MASEEHKPAESSIKAKPGKSAGALASNGAKKTASKSPRSRAREFALQGLYQYLVGQNDAASVDEFTRGLSGFDKCDSVFYDALLRGCIEQHADLDHAIEPCLDRPFAEVSPVERCVLWMGAYEFLHCKDIPWRVSLNESIELAKAFGGTDGHKWVNGVLNQLAPALRPEEVAQDAGKRSRSTHAA
jgi:transcription antitermination protein NusB